MLHNWSLLLWQLFKHFVWVMVPWWAWWVAGGFSLLSWGGSVALPLLRLFPTGWLPLFSQVVHVYWIVILWSRDGHLWTVTWSKIDVHSFLFLLVFASEEMSYVVMPQERCTTATFFFCLGMLWEFTKAAWWRGWPRVLLCAAQRLQTFSMCKRRKGFHHLTALGRRGNSVWDKRLLTETHRSGPFPLVHQWCLGLLLSCRHVS